MRNPYIGTWRITEMEEWEQDYVDMVVPDYIEFREHQSGEFQFGAVQGYMDYRIEPYSDSERLEFSWEGSDEMEPVSGRGWAMIKDGQLHGKLYFHDGDDSGMEPLIDRYLLFCAS